MVKLTVSRPFNPKYLWNTGPNTAELDTNFGDKGAYVQGFLDAAAHLAKELEASRLGVDIVVYPAIYLLRHGLELGFKALLATYHYEAENEDRFWYGHSLGTLWKQLEPQLQAPDYPSDESEYFAPDAVKYMADLVSALHDVDPDGEAARYDTNSDHTPTLAGVKRVNLSVLSDACAVAAEWMLNVTSHRHHVENFYRHERGYFSLPKPPDGPDTYARERKPFIGHVRAVLERAARGRGERKQYLTNHQIFARIPKGLRHQLASTKGAKARYGGEPDAGARVVADIVKHDLGKKLVETEQMSARGLFFRVDRTEDIVELGPTMVALYRLQPRADEPVSRLRRGRLHPSPRQSSMNRPPAVPKRRES